MNKVIKKGKPNMSDKGKTREPGRWQDEYFCHWSRKLKPVSDEYLEHIGNEFVDFCRKSRAEDPERRDVFSLERFLEHKGINEETFADWRKRNKNLDASVRQGMMIIGNMLEEGVIKKRYSEKATMFSLHNYLKRYEKDNKYHADLKNIKDAVAQLLGMTFEVPDLDKDKE